MANAVERLIAEFHGLTVIDANAGLWRSNHSQHVKFKLVKNRFDLDWAKGKIYDSSAKRNKRWNKIIAKVADDFESFCDKLNNYNQWVNVRKPGIRRRCSKSI